MNWRVTGVSVQGVSHARANLPCQDALAWSSANGPMLLAAVADGAGSARLAEVGASLAVRTGLKHLEAAAAGSLAPSRLESLLRSAFQQARDALAAESIRSKCELRDLACTLMLLAATPDHAAALQIGDGAALIAGPNGLRSLTRPPAAEYLNETLFLTIESALDHAQFASVSGPISRVAMFTDGLQMLALKMPEATPHERFFDPLFHFVAGEPNDDERRRQFEKFLTSPRIAQRADDDLTLLLATLAKP